ncbi:hypothetical protein [Caulobacter radicis]|uniref:hypothetical protein n=1 Tax=Caulobacter radicis TaxID=2172650 RepID=UPI001402127B|nr:hypothetical protein [Caulobacter radicis]
MVLASILMGERPDAFARALQLEYGRQAMAQDTQQQDLPALVATLLAQLVDHADHLRDAMEEGRP